MRLGSAYNYKFLYTLIQGYGKILAFLPEPFRK